MKNEGTPERGVQTTLSATLLILSLFWLSNPWSFVVGAFAIALGVFAIIGFCPLYVMFGINKPCSTDRLGVKSVAVIILLYVIIIIGGGYASNFLTKKFFVEDFNAMNAYYKQVLFQTGQEDRTSAIKNYDALVTAYAEFRNKYSVYRPFVLRNDSRFIDDLAAIDKIISDIGPTVKNGNLKEAHSELEKIRPITQEFFKRNGFSMLAISLVDFHDSMEKAIAAADEKNAAGIIAVYPEIDEKLKAIEQIANDAEIQLIRKNLDELFKMAQAGNVDALQDKAAELKSSFVKVYLKRG